MAKNRTLYAPETGEVWQGMSNKTQRGIEKMLKKEGTKVFYTQRAVKQWREQNKGKK